MLIIKGRRLRSYNNSMYNSENDDVQIDLGQIWVRSGVGRGPLQCKTQKGAAIELRTNVHVSIRMYMVSWFVLYNSVSLI